MILAIDASVATKWLLAEEHAAKAASVNAQRFDLAAPELLIVEVAHVLRKRQRRGELTLQQAGTMIDQVTGLPIKLLGHARLARAALTLSAKLDHSLHDCVYLAAALAEHCRLVTADRRLHDKMEQSPLAGLTLWIEDVP
jgi:predicted nucleic acid-binding protein